MAVVWSCWVCPDITATAAVMRCVGDCLVPPALNMLRPAEVAVKTLVKNASVPVTVRGITARGGASFVHGLADWAFRF